MFQWGLVSSSDEYCRGRENEQKYQGSDPEVSAGMPRSYHSEVAPVKERPGVPLCEVLDNEGPFCLKSRGRLFCLCSSAERARVSPKGRAGGDLRDAVRRTNIR